MATPVPDSLSDYFLVLVKSHCFETLVFNLSKCGKFFKIHTSNRLLHILTWESCCPCCQPPAVNSNQQTVGTFWLIALSLVRVTCSLALSNFIIIRFGRLQLWEHFHQFGFRSWFHKTCWILNKKKVFDIIRCIDDKIPCIINLLKSRKYLLFAWEIIKKFKQIWQDVTQSVSRHKTSSMGQYKWWNSSVVVYQCHFHNGGKRG